MPEAPEVALIAKQLNEKLINRKFYGFHMCDDNFKKRIKHSDGFIILHLRWQVHMER